jgi:hypothetical protein
MRENNFQSSAQTSRQPVQDIPNLPAQGEQMIYTRDHADTDSGPMSSQGLPHEFESAHAIRESKPPKSKASLRDQHEVLEGLYF